MNNAIELHDSNIESVRHLGTDLHLTFDPAYVHKSIGRPGFDSGEGHLQLIEMVFFNANIDVQDEACKGEVSDGVVKTSDQIFNNIVPIPINVSGKVEATITFKSGVIASITADRFSCVATGASRYLERFDV